MPRLCRGDFRRARRVIPGTQRSARAERRGLGSNVKSMLQGGVSHLAGEVSLPVSQDFVNCWLGWPSHHAELLLPSGANSRR